MCSVWQGLAPLTGWVCVPDRGPAGSEEHNNRGEVGQL